MIEILQLSNFKLIPTSLGVGRFFITLILILVVLPTTHSFGAAAQETPLLTAIPAHDEVVRGDNLVYSLSISHYSDIFPLNLTIVISLEDGNGSSSIPPPIQLGSVIEQKTISWKNLMDAGMHTVNISGFTPPPSNTPLFASFDVNVTIPTESLLKINVMNPIEEVRLSLNQAEAKNVIWEATNVGGYIADDVVIRNTDFALPAESIEPWNIFGLGSIQSGETEIWSISIYASEYGVGVITYKADYIDNVTSAEKSSESFTLNIYAVPDFEVVVNLPEKPGEIDETLELFLNMTNKGLIEVNLWVTYTPDSHFFIQSTNDTSSIIIEANSSITIFLLLLPKEPGLGKLTISIGLVGVQNLKLFDADISILVNEREAEASNLIYYLVPIIIISIIALFIIIYILAKKLTNFNFPLPLVIPESTISSFFDTETKYSVKKAIVDGSNVAWDSTSKKGKPRVINLINMIKALNEVGIEEVLIVADASLRHSIDDERTLRKLSKEGIVKMLAARIQADQVILRLSEETGAMVVSNDLFREWREKIEWIDERRIPFSIIQNKVLLHPPSEYLFIESP